MAHKYIRLEIHDVDGQTLLDDFIVCSARSKDAGSFTDQELVDDAKAEKDLIERIKAVLNGTT